MSEIQPGMRVQTPDGEGRVISVKGNEITVRLPGYTRNQGKRHLPEYMIRVFNSEQVQPLDRAGVGDRVFVNAVVGNGTIIEIRGDKALVALAGSDPSWRPLYTLTKTVEKRFPLA
jgi:FKBP-type peptidyl-prolyl cis-trans isomerase 2